MNAGPCGGRNYEAGTHFLETNLPKSSTKERPAPSSMIVDSLARGVWRIAKLFNGGDAAVAKYIRVSPAVAFARHGNEG